MIAVSGWLVFVCPAGADSEESTELISSAEGLVGLGRAEVLGRTGDCLAGLLVTRSFSGEASAVAFEIRIPRRSGFSGTSMFSTYGYTHE